ncbi:MAG: hypothetical protein H7306_17620 [Bacteriovorax sp.]|nr:hypothetical protein [Rhizobacter sp.]
MISAHGGPIASFDPSTQLTSSTSPTASDLNVGWLAGVLLGSTLFVSALRLTTCGNENEGPEIRLGQERAQP